MARGIKRLIDLTVASLVLILFAPLMRLVGADIEVVRPEQISEKIEESVGYLERRGFSPAIIPGGGHTLEGALAYVDAAGELMRRCDPVGWIPDIVIVPSGTGTT